MSPGLKVRLDIVSDAVDQVASDDQSSQCVYHALYEIQMALCTLAEEIDKAALEVTP